MRKDRKHCRRDACPPIDEMQALLDALMDLPQDVRAREALSVSSKLVEFAAFEAATVLPSTRVGELIDWAAQLDRQGDGVQGPEKAPSERLSSIIH